jgi:hypothetical protein
MGAVWGNAAAWGRRQRLGAAVGAIDTALLSQIISSSTDVLNAAAPVASAVVAANAAKKARLASEAEAKSAARAERLASSRAHALAMRTPVAAAPLQAQFPWGMLAAAAAAVALVVVLKKPPAQKVKNA